jgi:DNA-binding response OmpR family regulator
MAKILLVEDNEDLAGLLEVMLQSEKHTVEILHDGDEAREMLRIYKYDAVILDWDLPGCSGIDVLLSLRSRGDTTPVLMLTGNVSIDHKERGLDSGADDYLTKPFDSREFGARVRALLRRGAGVASNKLTVRDIELDPSSFSVTKGGQPVKLVQREFQLLEFFMRNPNRVFSAEAIMDRVWPNDSESSPEALRQTIMKVRKKLATDENEKPVIETVFGVGYKLVP